MRTAPSIKRLMDELRVTRGEAKHMRDCMHRGKLANVRVPGFYGVEWVSDANGNERFAYLNSGDTYSPTIVRYMGSSRYFISTMGSAVEALERRGVRCV